MITQTYDLNLIPNTVPLVVYVSQYDSDSRILRFRLYKGDEAYTLPAATGLSATLRGTKKDNTGFEYNADSILSENQPIEVLFTVKDQMTIFNGDVECEVRLSNNGGILGTANFILRVEKTTLEDDITISESDLPLLEEAEGYALRAESAASQAEALLDRVVYSVNGVLPDENKNVQVEMSDITNLINTITGINNDITNINENLSINNAGVNVDFNTLVPSEEGKFALFYTTIYNGASGINAPYTPAAGYDDFVVVSFYPEHNEANYFTTQIAIVVSASGSSLYYTRNRYNNSWSTWRQLLSNDTGGVNFIRQVINDYTPSTVDLYFTVNTSTTGVYPSNCQVKKNGNVINVSGTVMCGYNDIGNKLILTLSSSNMYLPAVGTARFPVAVEGPGSSYASYCYFDANGRLYLMAAKDNVAMTGNSYYYINFTYII